MGRGAAKPHQILKSLALFIGQTKPRKQGFVSSLSKKNLRNLDQFGITTVSIT